MSSLTKLAQFLQAIDQPARLQILLAIGEGETCVCHLEAKFGWRQAYLSQHLMALRKADILLARREGRYIHYRLSNPALLGAIRQLADTQAVALPRLEPSEECSCPNCCKRRGEK